MFHSDLPLACREGIAECLAYGTGWDKDGPKSMQATNTRNWVCQLRSVQVCHVTTPAP